jgi:hypothetical protein
MGPGPSTRARSPGVIAAASSDRHALPPGSIIAPAVSSTESGRACREPAGTTTCSASAPGKDPRMPNSERGGAYVVPTAPASATVAAAEHRVTGDAPPEQGRVGPGSDRGHGAALLVSQH